MIKVEEILTIEYETEEERENNIKEMKDNGYKLVQEYDSIDVNARNHFMAKFSKNQRGYFGESIFKKSK